MNVRFVGLGDGLRPWVMFGLGGRMSLLRLSLLKIPLATGHSSEEYSEQRCETAIVLPTRRHRRCCPGQKLGWLAGWLADRPV